MKNLLILTTGLCLLASYSANAQISVTLGEPMYVAPPIYYPPPVYAPGYAEYYHRYPSQYYDHRRHQRHGDWSYWAQHHDNGNHGEGNRGNRR